MGSEAMDRVAAKWNDAMWPVQQAVEDAITAGMSAEDIEAEVRRTIEACDELFTRYPTEEAQK